MKILFITQIYPIDPQKKSNDKRLALHYYVREWVKEHEVEVIRLHSFPIWYAWIFPLLGYPKSYLLDDVKVSNKLVVKFTNLKRSYRSVRKFAKQFSPDITIAHIPDSLMAAHDLYVNSGIRYVAGIQKTDYLKSGLKRGNHIYPFYRKLLENAAMVAFWSDFLKTEFLKSLPSIVERSIDMPGGLTSDWVANERMVKGWDQDRWNFVTVARLVKQKKLPVVFNGLAQSNEILGRYHLLGDGEEKTKLVKLSKELQIEHQTTFYGHLEVDEIVAVLDQCHIMVLLSTNETFGLVYLEAMARGCIVIGTKGEGIDGVIKHGVNGFLCKSAPEALAQLLRHIRNLPAETLEKISHSARETALRYQYQDLAKDYLAQLENHIDFK